MILLVGNYAPDRQESMLRFASMMQTGLAGRGLEARMLSPTPLFGRSFSSTISGIGKWMAYIDKYVLFPATLSRACNEASRSSARPVLHICDHSNAVYAKSRSRIRTLVTCHDLGAVRGALGEATECPASQMGQLLQRWIATGLGRADLIACDSTATRHDVERLVRTDRGKVPKTRTILLGQNAPYHRLTDEETTSRLQDAAPQLLDRPFVLNVGSSLARKNREGVLRIFARIQAGWPGMLVFAGEALPDSFVELGKRLGISDRVVQIANPSNSVLEALYNRAFALLFPSKFEGFGWPLIEAQACGCPVLCSDAGSLGEVAGDSAFVRPWEAEESFAAELNDWIAHEPKRHEWIRLGTHNVERFRTERMIDDYVSAYRELGVA